jgi:predicted protein tyrosine phosphatase
MDKNNEYRDICKKIISDFNTIMSVGFSSNNSNFESIHIKFTKPLKFEDFKERIINSIIMKRGISISSLKEIKEVKEKIYHFNEPVIICPKEFENQFSKDKVMIKDVDNIYYYDALKLGIIFPKNDMLKKEDDYLILRFNLFFQDIKYKTKNILVICNQGKYRSRTAYELLKNQCECKYVGYYTNDFHKSILEWSDIIICMDENVAQELTKKYSEVMFHKRLFNFEIADIYNFNDKELIRKLKKKIDEMVEII